MHDIVVSAAVCPGLARQLAPHTQTREHERLVGIYGRAERSTNGSPQPESSPRELSRSDRPGRAFLVERPSKTLGGVDGCALPAQTSRGLCKYYAAEGSP